MANSLGRLVVPRIQVQRERWPGAHTIKAIPLVQPGQEVLPDQPVLQIEATKALYEPSARALLAPRLISSSPGSPELVLSGLRGRVLAVTPRNGVLIESRAAVVQGCMGAGYQVVGKLVMWDGKAISEELPGSLLIVPGPASLALLHQALQAKAIGLIASSIELPDLEGFLHTDLLQLFVSRDIELASSYFPPLTLLFTEGVGEFPMPESLKGILQSYEGSFVLLSGLTSLAHRLLPELVISLPVEETGPDWQPVVPKHALKIGVPVRVMGGEYAGVSGILDHLFSHEQQFPSGIRTRAARVQLESGAHIIVPVVHLERIG